VQEILFVHDFQESPTTRKNYLEMSGYAVTLLKRGDDCIQRVAQKKPALILMDVLLEGRNGFDVCRAIREFIAPHDVPIILCSHIYRSRIYRDEAVAAGAQRYLLLPMKLDEILTNVNDLVSQRVPKARAS
jgi:CheY-like chemotaxis protein